jgi:hypothetical protein
MCHSSKQPWTDSLEAINWSGFEQEDGMKGFGVMNQQDPSKDEVLLKRVDDSHMEFKREKKSS